ncbi:YihY/virulence factor BrkB family protein [Limobrevibacterium gyesilva]|uniref:YihY/virulence factor BrkB family protein n=1 Tax=Limobrevibacterium gyesilva TaxID=2991712 RepID=A0AA41YQ17_9PROT|nr:YihY/virulence factor BrkB family protein [Limobrevibacterium gyesilva]MCW3476482.1 YihY/virulence factor BrkB family protein [Limobrevibacterium gyesilva]
MGGSLNAWRKLRPRIAGWWRTLYPTLDRLQSHRTSLAAAGCAFYATLALFPAISMLVSLYGLMFNPQTVEPQLELLRPLLPPEAYQLIARGLHALVSQPGRSLGLSLAIGAGVALWSASTGTKSVIAALNLAYEETERRGILLFQFIGLVMTLAAILGAVLAVALLVALPAVASFVGLPPHAGWLLRLAPLGVMMLFVSASFAALYRFGPSRRPGRTYRILPGTALATLLWLGASALFSIYAADIVSFDATYGPLGAVAGVMLWFWVSAYAVLAGAELNSALELQAERRESVSGSVR